MEPSDAIEIEAATEPGAEPRYVEFAKDQPEYLTLPALLWGNGQVVTEWTLTDEERLLIAAGAPIRLTVQLGEFICAVCGPHVQRHLLQPLRLEVGRAPQ